MDISYVFITHDLTAVTYICDRIIFFKDGVAIEEVNQLNHLKYVKNEYSKQLLQAALQMNDMTLLNNEEIPPKSRQYYASVH